MAESRVSVFLCIRQGATTKWIQVTFFISGASLGVFVEDVGTLEAGQTSSVTKVPQPGFESGGTF